ncbi:acetyl-CoA hydrolase/transferase C-terminal domain-containing protein [Bradyrhizobium sp. ORS 111]|uniref:acetyl-CoA hydrolase/transferase C-terminal domain-containing protein n=1 Tax=Bradyrhizobium sp. ORS 111 TaxID=1685958 RepID=UPI003890A1CF
MTLDCAKEIAAVALISTRRRKFSAAGGRSIIALPATVGNKGSRIVPTLGGPMTTGRSEVDIIITEFGAAELKGQMFVERARRMTAVAHSDYREASPRPRAPSQKGDIDDRPCPVRGS